MANVREVVSFLLRQGYSEARQSGSHLILKHPERNMVIVPVHRGKDLPKGLLLKILKVAAFTIEEFRKG